MSNSPDRPLLNSWWNEPGPESCEFCLQSFHLEVASYCADCDAVVCPACVVRIRERRVVVCPSCDRGGTA